MFSDIEQNIVMLKGAYKKLKSHCYYNRDMRYLKQMIAEFESDNDFESTFKKLAEALKHNNNNYFNSLMKKINIRAVVKKFASDDNESMPSTSNELLKKNKVESVNFFFNGPIEIHILDTLWTCFIAKSALDIGKLTTNMYGNRINKNSLLYTDGTINFKSTKLFERYIYNYSAWRDGTLEIIKEKYDSNQSTILYSLDLKGFFYSVDFNYDIFMKIFENDNNIHKYNVLTELMIKVQYKYTDKLADFRKGLSSTIKNSKSVFPIGLLSSFVLSNVYLFEFDKDIVEKIAPVRYARYVDDILIVKEIPDKELKNKYKDEKYLTQKLLDIFFDNEIFIENNNEYYLKSFKNIKIQKDKVACIHTASNKKASLFKVYDELFKFKPSAVDILPDFDLMFKSFSAYCYELESHDKSFKIKHLANLFPHNKKTSMYVYNFLKCCTGASIDLSKPHWFVDQIAENIDEMIEYFKSRQGIRFSSLWETIAYILVVSGKHKELEKFKSCVKKEINAIGANIDTKSENKNKKKIKDIKSTKISKVMDMVKDSLAVDIELACASANALCNIDDNSPILVKQIRGSNMFNNHLVLYALDNFQINNSQSLIETKTTKQERNILDNDKKIEFTPRFIRYGELNLYNFWSHLYCNTTNLSYEDIMSKFEEFNDLQGVNLKLKFLDGDISKVIHNPSCKDTRSESKIAIASVNFDENQVIENIQNRTGALSINNKRKVFKLIKEAVLQKADILVFPEFYLPYEWVNLISYICMKQDLIIITGIQYLVVGDQLKNYCGIFQPLISEYRQKSSIEIFREKNYYAPEEKYFAANNGYKINEPIKKDYSIVSARGFNYTTLICYEMTDINARAQFKGKVHGVFAIEFNKDTNYYCNLVESISRDLSCFVIQSNTSKYGDSRITAPYQTEEKDIVKIKGGVNDTIMVGKVNLGNLILHNQNTKDETGINQREMKKIKRQLKKLSSAQHKEISKEIRKIQKKEKPLPAGWSDDIRDC